jgi:hypothetical protein
MKKNNSLKKFNKIAKRVYKVSKKRKLNWKWQDAQKWTSANLFQQYKGTPISKIKVTEVDKNIISILDKVITQAPLPITKKVKCASVFAIPTKFLQDINWWMLYDAVDLFEDNLNIEISIEGVLETGIVKKSELPKLKDTVEDMRKLNYSSDDIIIFKVLVIPGKKDDGKPCSYYVLVTILGSNADNATKTDEIIKIVSEREIPKKSKTKIEKKLKAKEEARKAKENKLKALKKVRPSKVEGAEDEKRKELIMETLKNLEQLYNNNQISEDLYKANVKELKNKLANGGQI